ncbi:MAG TPA: sulfatase-like hydrolase/transferase [Acidimicrobiales bacterium]|nr:sulfatase-like hydrolase/transferase [Acidimicrobiales bacterium]
MNVLLVTLDQLRGDCLSVAGHPVVRTPTLDRLAGEGVRFSRHYSQAAPCGPGRACLYTGTYQLNNRVVGNGTPLDDRFDNVARAARRAGYAPAVFGYCDQAADPRTTTGTGDRRLSTYQGFPPGFDIALDLPDEQDGWRAWLEDLGYAAPASGDEALATEPARPAEHGVSAYLSNALIAWLERRDGPWFAHASYWRPHPPYAAAGEWASAYDPGASPAPLAPPARAAPFCGRLAAEPAPADPAAMARLQAQYFGMISDVDAQLGRVLDALAALGMWDDTMVVVTADHGEQLGDQGTLGKGGPFESSYHVPAIVRDPRLPGAHGTVVGAFTENVDVFPTICEAMGLPVPAQCDGMPLTAFLRGEEPPWWREAAHWEYDWRWEYIPFGPHTWPWDRRLESKHLTVRRSASTAYVQYGDGGWRCFDLDADPAWRTEIDDPGVVLGAAQAMLTWRSGHAERMLSDTLVIDGLVGRVPEAVR